MNFFKSLFSSKSGTISSKRVFGGIGFLICIVIAIIAVILEIDVTNFCSEILYVSAALLGVDSVMSAFKKGNKTDNNENEEL